jgi:hypothetical protein
MHDLEAGRLSLNTIFSALSEITHDSPTENDAKVLAEALDCLPVDRYRHLLEEARRSVVQEVDYGARRAEEQAATFSGLGIINDTVASRRATPSGMSAYPVRPAIVLQALIWAVLPPEDL